jgi:hypothetical protein
MRKPVAGIPGACFIILLLLAGCTILSPQPTSGQAPATTQKILLYPGAQNLVIKDKVPNSKARWQVATYEVSAKPEDVFNFYRDTLSKDGWVMPSIQTSPAGPHHFDWQSTNDIHVYSLDLATAIIGQGKTHVTVEFLEDSRL